MSRTVVDIRDDLVRKALRLSGLKKKVDVVNLALEELVRTKDIRKILELQGKIKGSWNPRGQRP